MKVKVIKESSVTAEDINEYKKRTSKLKGIVFNANDVDMDKRIVSIRLGNVEDELVLVNPRTIKTSEKPVVYFEKDSTKNKTRKTVRFTYLLVETDNLGQVEFKSEKESWENIDDFMSDTGLLECVLAQRAIDSINGMDITHPLIAYNPAIKAPQKIGRNERVMIQSPEGESMFIKYKNARPYLDNGYIML
jgi:hypothetical protein